MTFDQTSSIVSLILNFVLGTGIIGTLFFFKSKKRVANADAGKAEAEVERAEAETDTINLENLKNLCESLGRQLDGAYREIERFSESMIDMQKRNTEISIELVKVKASVRINNDKIVELEGLLEYSENNKCVVDECPLRNPPKVQQKKSAKDGKTGQPKGNKQSSVPDKET